MQRISPFVQHRLDEVRRVHHAARRGARTDDGVDLIDEQDRARLLLQLGDHALQALLEIAAVLRARDERAHVERVDGAVGQHLGDLALDDEAREALGDRGLAHAGFADVERIVLAAAAEDLDGAFHFELAPDERIDLAFLRLAIQVAGVFLQRIAAAFGVALAFALRVDSSFSVVFSSAIFERPCEM